MFRWFGNRAPRVWKFTDNDAAFDHACGIGYQPLLDSVIPALIREEGGPGNDGEHLFLIALAGPKGGRRFWSCTLKGARATPKAGDLVGFRVVTIANDLPEQASLIGYISCRLEPVFVEGKGWVISESYTPAHLKPALRL